MLVLPENRRSGEETRAVGMSIRFVSNLFVAASTVSLIVMACYSGFCKLSRSTVARTLKAVNPYHEIMLPRVRHMPICPELTFACAP